MSSSSSKVYHRFLDGRQGSHLCEVLGDRQDRVLGGERVGRVHLDVARAAEEGWWKGRGGGGRCER